MSGLGTEKKGANETDCVGVEAKVCGVPVEFFPFFFKAPHAVLQKVEIESVSLQKPKETLSAAGISNIIGLSAEEVVVAKEERRPAELSVKSYRRSCCSVSIKLESVIEVSCFVSGSHIAPWLLERASGLKRSKYQGSAVALR